MITVSVVPCETYELDTVRRSVRAALASLGSIRHFVHPGMRVLLKPNLLSATELEQAVTTHPIVVQAVAELVQEAGGTVLIGDSPAGPNEGAPKVWRKSQVAEVADQTGATIVPFDSVTWKRLNGSDYFVARPVFEADLIVNLPKLKTHIFTLYTGAVKNLFGVISGNRKREIHLRAPGVGDFSRALVDVLELAQPRLTIMDGIKGQEGKGPGPNGTPRHYGCLAASADPVALDTAITQAMGYRSGEVLHLVKAGKRGLGIADPEMIRVEGERGALDFGPVWLPTPRWYFRIPSWIGASLQRRVKVRPRLLASACTGCGQCAKACPREVITPGKPARFDLDDCIGCLCCAEICPQAAIEVQRNLIARLVGLGG